MRTAFAFLCVLSALALSSCAAHQDTAARDEPIDASPPWAQVYTHEAVAADHAIASEAGAAMLRRGGNAVDAAVATAFTLSVVRPYSCGIGGGGFMVVYLAEERRAIAINYRETCPREIGPATYENDPDPLAPTRGGKAVATPGTVAGLLYALDRYGTLERGVVLAPAILAAQEGFIVDAHYANMAQALIARFEERPEWKQRFAFVWERYLREGRVQEGDRIVNPEQARALRMIAISGAAEFYRGRIADAMVRAVGADGGVLSIHDLHEYAPLVVQPLRYEFAGKQFIAMPPPSSGGVAMAQALGILERVDAWHELDTAWSPARMHLVIEALKHAFADRSRWLGDPEFVRVPVDALLDDDNLSAMAERISLTGSQPGESYGFGEFLPIGVPHDSGTSHLCVVDRWGNAVACTETINLEFGSLVAVPEFGFCLNNEMDDFTAHPGEPNAFGLRQSDRNSPMHGKRPLSSMSPTIVLDVEWRVVAVAGASGGPRIISSTLQILLSVLSFDMSARDAMARPRFHHQWMPDVLRVEGGAGSLASLDESTRQTLRALGHDLQELPAIGNAQLILRRGGMWEAACDPRKGGRPGGR